MHRLDDPPSPVWGDTTPEEIALLVELRQLAGIDVDDTYCQEWGWAASNDDFVVLCPHRNHVSHWDRAPGEEIRVRQKISPGWYAARCPTCNAPVAVEVALSRDGRVRRATPPMYWITYAPWWPVSHDSASQDPPSGEKGSSDVHVVPF